MNAPNLTDIQVDFLTSLSLLETRVEGPDGKIVRKIDVDVDTGKVEGLF